MKMATMTVRKATSLTSIAPMEYRSPQVRPASVQVAPLARLTRIVDAVVAAAVGRAADPAAEPIADPAK